MTTYKDIRYTTISVAPGITGRATVYSGNSVIDLPSSNLTAGEIAYLNSNLYVTNGNAWYRVGSVNETPTINITPNSVSFSEELTSNTITYTITEPENTPTTVSISYSFTSDANAVLYTNNNTIDVSVLNANTWSGDMTITVSDGENTGTATLSLEYVGVIAYSSSTSFLMKAVGNEGNNTSITDSSTNTHTVTVNGNTQATSFSPYRQGGYSYYFDGSGDSLNTTATQVVPTTSFTVAAWVYFSDTTNGAVWAQGTFGNSGRTAVSIEDGNWFAQIGNTTLGRSTSVSAGQWYYTELQWDGSTLEFFVNGTSLGSASVSTSPQNSAFYIGDLGGSAWSTAYPLNGYVADLRVVSSTPSGSSTVPIERLTAITNTSLLTCHLPYLADGSTNNHTLTISGNVSAKAFAPYDYTLYSTSSHGGSVYFDGSGDYATVPADTTNLTLDGDFTIDFWVYPTSAYSSNEYIYGKWNLNSDGWAVFVTTDWSSGNFGSLTFYYGNYGTNESATSLRTEKIKQNQWNHCRITRESGVFYMAINGVVGTRSNYGANGLSWSDTRTFNADTTIGIGGQTNYSHGPGYISDLRVIKGTAVTTTDFTPPTSPVSSSGADLHIKGTDVKVYDTSQTAGALTLAGNAASSTTQKKYASSSSVAFDGSGDSVLVSNGNDIANFGSNDFTIEYWLYLNDTGVNTPIGWRTGGGASNTNWLSQYATGLKFWASNGSTYVVNALGGGTLSSGQWYHIAVTRNGSTFTQWINGVSDGTATSSSAISSTSRPLYLGYDPSTSTNALNGYIQDLRITKGLARYTSSFTPPTMELKG